MRILIVADCDRVSFRAMPFLPVDLLESSLTPDNVGAGVLAPVRDPAPGLEPIPDPVVGAAATSSGAVNGPHAELAGSSPASPP